MIVEGIHYLATDPPQRVAWKLVAVMNLSDLAAKGARPLGVLLGYALSGDDAWDTAFVAGLGQAIAAFNTPLLGGDTVAAPAGGPRSLGPDRDRHCAGRAAPGRGRRPAICCGSAVRSAMPGAGLGIARGEGAG